MLRCEICREECDTVFFIAYFGGFYGSCCVREAELAAIEFQNEEEN